MWLRRIFLAGLLVMASGLANCMPLDDGDPYNDQPVSCDRPDECSEGETACHGDKPAVCSFDISQNCEYWDEGSACTDVGATCVPGGCVFDETCPDNVDAFCRNGHVLECPLKSFLRNIECSSYTPCQEVIDRDGRKQAACATTDPPCADTEGAKSECRGDELFTCWYGLVVNRTPCGPGHCLSHDTEAGPLASCDTGYP